MVAVAAPAAPPPLNPAPRRVPSGPIDTSSDPTVPAWVNRWKAKLPDKLRSTVTQHAAATTPEDISERGNSAPPSPAKNKSPAPSPAPSPAKRATAGLASAGFLQENSDPQATVTRPSIFANRPKAEPPASKDVASSSSADESVAGWSQALMEAELESERRRRVDAEKGKREALERAAVLNMQVDGLRDEIERLQMILRRIDISSVETASDAREMSEMFTRLAAEAESVAVEKEAEMERECTTPGGTVVEVVPSPSTQRQMEAQELAAKEEYDPEYAEVQFNFMSLQYDDIFTMLEKREGDNTLALYRASWLRRRHMEEELEELLPKDKPSELPPEARISARELRAIFAKAYGGGGYRKVDLPFITVTQFWVCREHPDPEEDCLQGVIAYLQAHWEDFTDRDVAIYIDLGKPTDPRVVEELEAVDDADATEAVLWLVTSRARTRMAAAHHEAFMQQLERSTAPSNRVSAAASPRASGEVPSASTPNANAAAETNSKQTAAPTPVAAQQSSGLKRSSAETSLHAQAAAEEGGGGWSSARSQGSSSNGNAPSTASNGMGSEDVL